MLDFLSIALRYGLSLCVTGSTGSGKTTLMSWLLSTVPDDKRIFTIENGCREFDLVREDEDGNVLNNVVHTVTRYSDDPKQNYDQERLLEFALTCNPDIICVGEMKSAEAFAAQEAPDRAWRYHHHPCLKLLRHLLPHGDALHPEIRYGRQDPPQPCDRGVPHRPVCKKAGGQQQAGHGDHRVRDFGGRRQEAAHPCTATM